MKQHINPEEAKYHHLFLTNQGHLSLKKWPYAHKHIIQHIILLVLPLSACIGPSFTTVLNSCWIKNSLNNCVPCHESPSASQTPKHTVGNHAEYWADVIQSWIRA